MVKLMDTEMYTYMKILNVYIIHYQTNIYKDTRIEQWT